MLLEKLEALKLAIKATADEVSEEADLLLNGSELKSGLSSIVSLVNDLKELSENLDFLEEPSVVEEPTEEEQSLEFEETSEVKLSAFLPRFKNGDEVKLLPFSYIFSPSSYLFVDAGIDQSVFGPLFYDVSDCFRPGDIGKISRTFESLHETKGTKTTYVVEYKKRLFFVHESCLKKVE